MCASFLQVPELAIDENEAKLLADAVANVAKHYDFLPDLRTQAWFNLFMIAGPIYGMRIWAIRNKSAQTKQNKQATPAQTGPILVMPTGAPPIGVVN